MKLSSTIVSLLLLSAVSTASPARPWLQEPDPMVKPGIVIEKVERNSEAEKSGILPGDVVLRWTRSDVHGETESPFDLYQIEIEQEPRGVITIEGLRGSERKIWTLGPDTWGLLARPNFANAWLSTYCEGQEMENAGNPAGAARHWRSFGGQAPALRPAILRVWMLLRSARTFADARRWTEADEAYLETLKQSSGTSPAIVASVARAWADTFQRRSDWINAEKYYQQAMRASQKLSRESLEVAANLYSLGTVARQRGDLVKAEEYYRSALSIREKVAPGSLAVAASINNLGNIAWDRGDLPKAEYHYREALAIREKLAPGRLDVASTLNNLGLVFQQRGDLSQAENYYRQGLEIREKLAPASLEVARSFNNLGMGAWQSGDLEKAEDYHRQSLTIKKHLSPGSLDVAVSLQNLGIVMWERGDLAKAEECYRQAFEIQEKLAPKSPDTAGNLSNLGLLSVDQGDLPRAQKYFRQALVIAQKAVPNSPGMADILNGLGLVAQESGDLAKAEKYYRQALAMWERVAPGSPHVARILNNLGMAARERGDLTGAEKFIHKALSLQEKLSQDSSVVLQILHSSGDVARDSGDLARAEEYYRQALVILEKLAPASSGRAETLASLAGIMSRKQQFQVAAELFAQSLAVLEDQTTHLGGGEEVRSGFRAKHATYYKAYIDLLIAQKQPELAFHVLERSRARMLLETLAQARVDIHTGVDARLLEEERSLRSQISAKSERRLRLIENGQREDQVTLFDREIAELLSRYHEVQDQIRRNSPAYAALTQPQPLTAKEMQEQLLDTDTLLLEYALGEKHSYVFAVSPDSVMVGELPTRSEIESAARRVYRLLTAENGTMRGETRLRRQTRLTAARDEFPKAAADLARMVLAPVEAEISKRKRLLIVSDGALQYIPFAALPAPGGPSTPLAMEYEIVNLPSASALAALRKELAGRRVAPKVVAVLADPVFNPHDDRLRVPSTSTASQSAPPDFSQSENRYQLNRSATQAGVARGGLFPRLPFTRREAETIASIASKGEAIEALDFDASKATAIGPKLRDYRILHFATHGLLNSEHPELSGLVFSLVDRQGHSQDGFLRLLDIYNLDLNADLVVLSACQTALGKQIEQEGLVGLTRGFMYAGAARVVASLWKVDDEATAELMKRFYEGMLREKQTPAKALRAAQVWLRAQKKWRDPYYWAGFVLQGEWK